MYLLRAFRSRRPATRRRATAAVEFAGCVPVMLVLLLGSIETSDMIFLRQILKTAAYEGARVGTAPGKTASAAIAAARQVLTQRGVKSGDVAVSPSSLNADTATGTVVKVTVTAPMGSNACINPVVIRDALGTMSVDVTMIRQ